MAWNRDNTQDDFLTDEDTINLQRFILEEIQQRSMMTSPPSIYWAVRERFCDARVRCRLDRIKNRIFEMIESALKSMQSKLKPAVECDSCEPAKLKNRKGEKNKKELAKTNQLVAFDGDDVLALQEEHEREEKELMNQALLQSKIHLDDQMEFEKELKETLAKSYEEEKSKLLTMLTVEDFDFESLADQLNKVLPAETTVVYKGTSLIHRSALILAIIQLFDYDYTIVNAKPIHNHIRKFGQCCMCIGSNVTYQDGNHKKNASSTFNVFSMNNHLINIEIRGDGNCMWGSISHSLVGDYSMMESLRLLTAYALIQYSEKFSEILTRQTSKFSYNGLTLEQLMKASVSLQSWGDEFHLTALSLALKRPIYSYGSLIDIPDSAYMGYEQFRRSYEIESFPNHFKFIGDANDSNNEPLLLHYDGFSHYSSVLKRFDSVKPLVPFIQIIDFLFNGNEVAQSGEPDKLVDIESSMTANVSNVKAEWNGNKSDHITDAGQSDEIAKLHKDLREKDTLLQQYDSFLQEVKKMLDNQKIDLGQLKDFVEAMENRRK